MKVINLFGGPGCGKSTTAAHLFVLMKIAGRNVELITEYAKDLLWSDRLDNMLDQQEYIFAKQNYRLHRLRDKVDFAITDSPLLLSCVYPATWWPAYYDFATFVRAANRTYDNINIFINRIPDEEKYQNEGRLHSFNESMSLDEKIRQELELSGMPYYEVQLNPEVAQEILEAITHELQ